MYESGREQSGGNVALLQRDRPAPHEGGEAAEWGTRSGIETAPAGAEGDPLAALPAASAAVSRPAGRFGALAARRLIHLLALRIGPALAGGLIALSHTREPGEAAIVFIALLASSQLMERPRFPLELMPAARVMLGLATPLLGVLVAWALITVLGRPYPLAQLEAVLLGVWLMLALGAWIHYRLTSGLRSRVAVIGPRDFAADLAGELSASGIDRFEVLGWVGGGGPNEYHRLSWLGGLDDVRDAVTSRRIDLLVCAPRAAEAEGMRFETLLDRIATECIDLPVRLIAANQLYEEALGHVPAGTIDAAWYGYIMHPRFQAGSPLSKRLFDLVGAAVIGLLFLPATIAAAIAIKLRDGGPVLYRQRRLGEHGEGFEILKLRTMSVDAEPDGPLWAEPDDPRVTPVGRLLRRSHLDEVPQLWNVIRGEMTLVGPRPERPEIVSELELRFPHYARRQLVKPGIAGWAALRCGYAGSDLGTAWKLCHDLFYIKHRSVLADALILAETAVEVFRDAHRALRAPRERFLLARE